MIRRLKGLINNDYALNENDNKMYLGLGRHNDITNRLLDDMFGNHLDQNLYELISIKYWNSPYYKIIDFYLPQVLTEQEFNNFKLLEDYYKELFSKQKITVDCHTFGDNVFEYGPLIEQTSKMDIIIDFVSERVDKTLVRTKHENIIKI